MDVWMCGNKCIHSSIFFYYLYNEYKNNKMGRIMPTEESKAVWQEKINTWRTFRQKNILNIFFSMSIWGKKSPGSTLFLFVFALFILREIILTSTCVSGEIAMVRSVALEMSSLTSSTSLIMICLGNLYLLISHLSSWTSSGFVLSLKTRSRRGFGLI